VCVRQLFRVCCMRYNIFCSKCCILQRYLLLFLVNLSVEGLVEILELLPLPVALFKREGCPFGELLYDESVKRWPNCFHIKYII
jgi:hypothetical protein